MRLPSLALPVTTITISRHTLVAAMWHLFVTAFGGGDAPPPLAVYLAMFIIPSAEVWCVCRGIISPHSNCRSPMQIQGVMQRFLTRLFFLIDYGKQKAHG